MPTLNSRNPENMLFALLRAALHQREAEASYFQKSTEDDWQECFRLAVRQGVAALAEEDFSVEDAARVLVDRYGIDEELALKDARRWVESLKECGVIEQ